MVPGTRVPLNDETIAAAFKEHDIGIVLARDDDETEATYEGYGPVVVWRKARERRAAFLTQVVVMKAIVFKRGPWPIMAISASLTYVGGWRIRVQYMACDRDTRKPGIIEGVYCYDPAPTTRGLLRDLMRAVHNGLHEAFEHESAECLTYQGKRLLDPHEGEPA